MIYAFLFIFKVALWGVLTLIVQTDSLAIDLNYGIYSGFENTTDPIYSHRNTLPVVEDDRLVSGLNLGVNSSWDSGTISVDAESRNSSYTYNEQLNDTSNQLHFQLRQGIRKDKVIFYINDDLQLIKDDITEPASISNEEEVQRLEYGLEANFNINSRNLFKLTGSESAIDFQNDSLSNTNSNDLNVSYQYIASKHLNIEFTRSDTVTRFSEQMISDTEREYISKFVALNYNDSLTNMAVGAGEAGFSSAAAREPDVSITRFFLERGLTPRFSASINYSKQLINNSVAILEDFISVSRVGGSVEERVELNIVYRNNDVLRLFARNIERDEINTENNATLVDYGFSYETIVGYSRLRLDYKLQNTNSYQNNALQFKLYETTQSVTFESRIRRNTLLSVYYESRESEERVIKSEIADNRFGIRLSYVVGQ